jgi:hypothetical protein
MWVARVLERPDYESPVTSGITYDKKLSSTMSSHLVTQLHHAALVGFDLR